MVYDTVNGVTIVPKVWGREVWMVNRPEYCGKILEMFRDARTSVHYHERKVETMYCLQGAFDVKFWQNGYPGEMSHNLLEVGGSIHIPKGLIHSLVGIGLENKLIEISTQHFDEDSIRLNKGG